MAGLPSPQGASQRLFKLFDELRSAHGPPAPFVTPIARLRNMLRNTRNRQPRQPSHSVALSIPDDDVSEKHTHSVPTFILRRRDKALAVTFQACNRARMTFKASSEVGSEPMERHFHPRNSSFKSSAVISMSRNML